MSNSEDRDRRKSHNWQLFFDKITSILNLFFIPASFVAGIKAGNDATATRYLFYIICIFSLLIAGHIWLIYSFRKQVKDTQETIYIARDVNKRMKYFLKAIESVSNNTHAFAHGFRDHMMKLVHGIETVDYRGYDFKDFIEEELGYIAAVFSRLTRDTCAACIKLIIPPGGDKNEDYVYTYARDRFSFHQRRGTDRYLQEYKLSEFSPFWEIRQEGRQFKICRNLEEDIKKGLITVHPNRLPAVTSDYNAFCIVPIRVHKKGEEKPIIIAFLCIDNKEGNFDKKIAFIAAAFADLLYYAFLINGLIGDQRIKLQQQI